MSKKSYKRNQNRLYREIKRKMARNNYAAQMEMLGYQTDGNPRDMVEVVRCKDCKYCGSQIRDGIKFAKCELKHNWMPQPEWFCSDGERRDDDG